MAHAVGFTDWDIVNAHPEILLQICKACGLACINLEYYCTHRDELLSKIISATGCDRGRAKNLFLRLLYLGKYQFWLDGDDKDPTIIAHEIFQQKIPDVLTFLNDFENELEKIATLIFENNKHCKSKERSHFKSPFISHVLPSSRIRNSCHGNRIQLLQAKWIYFWR